jgi:hypothetical protein
VAFLQLKLVGTDVKAQMEFAAQRQRRRVAQAARRALEEAGERIVTAGKEDMLAGGNFGSPRWQTSLTAPVLPVGVETSNLTLSVRHAVPFWRIFEYSGKILGRPLLWIPLPWNPTKVRARDFPGKLFRVDREGKNPLLMTGRPARAMYVGVKSVFLRRRFHLRPIIRRVAKTMPALFRKWMRLAKVS